MATTPNRNYPLPDEANDIDQEFWTLMLSTLPMIDLDMQSLLDALGGKAEISHPHQLSDVEGLVSALEGKMPANALLTLAGLADVEGMGAAPDGYVPVKIGSKVVFMSLAAATGNIQVAIAQVQGLAQALGLLAPKASPAFTENPTAPTQAPGNNSNRLATTAFVQAAISALSDYWALQPLGVPIPAFDHIAGVAAPATDKAYRYAKLTASDVYNTGVLTGEVVSGSAPLLTASAVVSLEGSPLNGRPIRLINTERRFLRAGDAGLLQDDALQEHTHGGGISGQTTSKDGNNTEAARQQSQNTQTLATGTTGRFSNETRPRNIGATYYMRIK